MPGIINDLRRIGGGMHASEFSEVIESSLVDELILVMESRRMEFDLDGLKFWSCLYELVTDNMDCLRDAFEFARPVRISSVSEMC